MHFPDSIAAGRPGIPSGFGIPRSVRGGTHSSGATRIAAWLVPDLALSAAVVTLIYLLFFYGGATALFRDSDAGWHIRAGERILARGALPRTDPFSFSKAGEAWIAWEWLADAITGGVHGLAGLGGVVFLYAIAISASVWMWFRLNWAAGGDFLTACVFASPMLSTVNLHWLARPHVFGWLFLLGAVWFCETLPRRVTPAVLALVALGSAVWANIHGSFFLGPLTALIYFGGAWLTSRLWDEPSRHATRFLAVAVAAAGGSLLNPRGWELHRHVFGYLFDSALLDRIGEFQSFNFHAEGSAQIIAALLLGAGGGFAALSVRRPERFVLAMLLTAGALRSARMLPVAALILLPLANGSVTEALARVDLAAPLRRRVRAILAYGMRLRALDRGLHGLALAPVIALMLAATVRASHPGFPPDQFPVAASNVVATLPRDARIFAPDKFGGYLIYRFDGRRKVFFDGRSDFYGADFLRRYARMVQLRPGWTEEFSKWGFTHALLPPDYSLVPALSARGWSEIYRDRTAVLLAAPSAVSAPPSLSPPGEPWADNAS